MCVGGGGGGRGKEMPPGTSVSLGVGDHCCLLTLAQQETSSMPCREYP